MSQDAVTTAQPQRSPDADGMTQTMYHGFLDCFPTFEPPFFGGL